MSDYQPYGKEWEAEFMKWTKKDIIGMIRKLCLDLGEKTYTLADLEQARKQGAEDERGRCVEAIEQRMNKENPEDGDDYSWYQLGVLQGLDESRAIVKSLIVEGRS